MLNIKQNNQFFLVAKFSDANDGDIAQHTLGAIEIEWNSMLSATETLCSMQFKR